MEIVEIENRWSWGETINMICEGCGVCHLEFKDGTEWGYVYGLTVHPSRRRQGIASRLMEKAEEDCVYYRYGEIRLDVEKTRRFQFEWYKRLGYEVFAEDNDLYYMKKDWIYKKNQSKFCYIYIRKIIYINIVEGISSTDDPGYKKDKDVIV